MDTVLKEVNKDLRFDKINAYYSTAEAFLQGVKMGKKEGEWPEYDGDLFPYLTNTGEYWTGYYSTNVQFKSLVRKAIAYVHFASNMYAISGFGHS